MDGVSEVFIDLTDTLYARYNSRAWRWLGVEQLPCLNTPHPPVGTFSHKGRRPHGFTICANVDHFSLNLTAMGQGRNRVLTRAQRRTSRNRTSSTIDLYLITI